MRGPIITFKRARRLRREMSLPEVLLWRHLRGHGAGGLRFRRQHPIGPYVLDFFCVEMLLCVEVDGYAHDNAESAAHDERRTDWLAQQGIRVLRIFCYRGDEKHGRRVESDSACSRPLHQLRWSPSPAARRRIRGAIAHIA